MALTGSPGRLAQEAAFQKLNLCEDVLRSVQHELYASMRFLDLAISALLPKPEPELSGQGNRLPFASDGISFFYEPDALLSTYQKSRILVNRVFLHSVLHCIFCHFSGRGDRNERLWDLSCDIAVEHILDSFSDRALHIRPSQIKTECYARLQRDEKNAGAVKVMNAESIYKRMFLLYGEIAGAEDGGAPSSEAAFDASRFSLQSELISLEHAFSADNHCFWNTGNDRAKTAMQISARKKWENIRSKMQTAMETGDKDAGKERDALLTGIRAENHERRSYRDLLRRFAVLREELHADEDSFDYIYYTLGMQLYGNMPLIEPQETREIFAVEEFVVVLDTSFSTSGELVRRFLEETFSVLSERESYFQKVHIRILQCDDRVESDVLITCQKDLEEYMQHFTLVGQGGTDFRPAFAYVDGLIKKGEFKKLRGLIYFTDGKGIYPLKRPAYETAFVFLDHNYDDFDVPGWAVKIVLDADELKPGTQNAAKPAPEMSGISDALSDREETSKERDL